MIKHVTPNDPTYPALLREIQNPPQKLFIRGESITSENKNIAIVGTRKATSVGLKLAEGLAEKLADNGFTIISGLAMGIDAAAHRGALKSGKTIAVLGTEIDSIYPRCNENLGLSILERGGTIVSEYQSGDPYRPQNFLARNRIISGLSNAVIIIEAPERSGSLSTAHAAAEQGRDVFVFPGPVDHPNYRGSHALIRDGARLVASINDVLSDLGIDTEERKEIDTNNLNLEEAAVVSALLASGIVLNIDRLVELTRLESRLVNTAVATLVIKVIIKEENGQYQI